MLAPLQGRKETHDGMAPLLGFCQRRILRHLGAPELFPMRPSQLRHAQLAKVMHRCFTDSLKLCTYRFVFSWRVKCLVRGDAAVVCISSIMDAFAKTKR